MLYRELLAKLQRLGIKQLARSEQQGDDGDIAYLGRPEGIVVPFPVPSGIHYVYRTNGDDTVIHDEIIEAILRRFDIAREDFDNNGNEA